MARPTRSRKICKEPKYRVFAPVQDKTGGMIADTGSESGHKVTDTKSGSYDRDISHDIILTFDEYETIRLIDSVGLTQEQCARHMGAARTTVTDIYDRARNKIADMLINGRELAIEGGNYSVCNGARPDGEGMCDMCRSMCT